MEYGSKYMWVSPVAQKDEEEMEISNVADDLWAQVEARPMSLPSNPSPAPSPFPATPSKKVKVKKADTNVLSVNFGTLVNEAQLATGDPVACKNCKALFNYVSVITNSSNSDNGKSEVNEDNQHWSCEFCGTENQVQLYPEEIPKDSVIDYIIEPPTENKTSFDESTLVFCIDISGSMGVSYEVQGKFKLKGEEKIQKLSQYNTERTAVGGFADQWLPHERRDITYVTRLQCVQAAIDTQFEQLKKEYPNKRVAIITFNNEVTIIGDGTKQPVVITGDKLNSYEQLLEMGKQQTDIKPINESKSNLSNKLFGLEEGGSTALGPALVAALGICVSSPGSKIVICTDGLSNVGLGSLDDLITEDQKDQVSQFYEQVGLYAKTQGVTISVLSIKGSDCSLENLGQLSDLTSGSVDRVDPLNITKDFQSIMSSPVIATHVTAKLLLHKGLFVRTENTENSVETRDVGNVTTETSITFEYGIREENREEFAKLKQLPFQLQVTYTKMDGMKCMRCITQTQEITFDQKQAEEQANVRVLSVNAVQQTARMASNGDYVKARAYNLNNKVMLERTAKSTGQVDTYSKWVSKGREFEEELQSVQKTEISNGLDLEEDDDDEEAVESKKKEKRSKSRKQNRSDSTANMLFKFKNLTKF